LSKSKKGLVFIDKQNNNRSRHMKAHSKVFTLLVLFALWIGSAVAIEHTVGLRGGLTMPFVDMDDEVTNHIMGGINYEAWLLDYLSLGIYPYYHSLKARKAQAA
jgi:hypothetical protein